jgi:hypothetical protein
VRVHARPTWGAIADTLHRHKQVHVLCHVTSGLLIGLHSAFQRGIGSGTASLVGGYIYDEYGVRTM